MLTVKEAATIAVEYFAHLFEGKDLGPVLLEEAEMTEDEQYWLITLSHDTPTRPIASIVSPPPRSYKTFKIDASTEAVVSMKIRQLQ